MKLHTLHKHIVLTAILSIFGALLLSACNSPPEPQFDETRHVVKRGDTMWSICEEYKPVGMDMREYVSMCCKASETDGTIYPGDVVILFTEVQQ